MCETRTTYDSYLQLEIDWKRLRRGWNVLRIQRSGWKRTKQQIFGSHAVFQHICVWMPACCPWKSSKTVQKVLERDGKGKQQISWTDGGSKDLFENFKDERLEKFLVLTKGHMDKDLCWRGWPDDIFQENCLNGLMSRLHCPENSTFHW